MTEEKLKNKVYTPDGYEVVFISEYFFDVLEKALKSISRGHPNTLRMSMHALRDAKALVEFRRFETNHE